MVRYFLWRATCALVLLAGSSWGVLSHVSAQSSLNDPEFTEALDWASNVGMTRFSTEETFMPLAYLTREQGAQFFAQFAIQELGFEPDTNRSCAFNDIGRADSTLIDAIITSCQLWLFQWSDGNFYPQDPLTKAQAIAVLVRAFVGMQDESATPWWNQYYVEARDRGRTIEPDAMSLNKPVTRYETLLIQFRSRGSVSLASSSSQETDDVDMNDPAQLQASSETLMQILQQLFGTDFQEPTTPLSTSDNESSDLIDEILEEMSHDEATDTDDTDQSSDDDSDSEHEDDTSADSEVIFIE